MYFDTAVHLIAGQKGDNRLECFSNMLSCWQKFLHLIWSQYLPSIRPEAIYGHVIKVLRKCGDVEIAVVWYWAPLRAQSEWWGQTWASVEVTGCSERMLVPGAPCPIDWAPRCTLLYNVWWSFIKRGDVLCHYDIWTARAKVSFDGRDVIYHNKH